MSVAADITDFERGMGKVEKATAKIGGALSSIGQKMTVGLTAPLLGAGAASVAFSEKLDDAMDGIRSMTGATGPELEKLGTSFRNVFSRLPVSAEEAAAAIGKLAARTGQSGPALERLASQALNVSRLMDEDLNTVIDNSSRLFGDWGISVDKQSGSMDYLFKVAQQTGASFSELGGQLVQFGAPLRQLGFSFEESAALLGKFEQDGVNAELVLGSLRIALAGFAKEGVNAPQALRGAIESIQNMQSASDATAQAIQIFGRRAGPDMAAAIREGRFSVDELLARLAASPETIDTAAAATKGFGENMTTLRNAVMVALEPLGVALVNAFTKMQPQIEAAVAAIANATKWFSELSPATQELIFKTAALAVAIGPLLNVIGSLMTMMPLLKLGFATLGGATGVGAAIAAAGALVAAGIALADNWEIIRFEVKNLADEVAGRFRAISQAVTNAIEIVWNQLVGRFNRAVESVREKVEVVTSAFRTMYDKVVGHSYVPDMIEGIGKEFRKLDALMVGQTTKVVGATNAAFSKLSQEIDIANMIMERHARAVERIKSLRVDLMFETNAKSVKRLQAELLELETVSGKYIEAVGKIADAWELPKVKIEVVGNTALKTMDGITEKINASTENTVAKSKTAADALEEWGRRWTKIAAAFGVDTDFVTAVFGDRVGKMVAQAGTMMEGLREIFTIKWKEVVNTFVSIWNTIKDAIKKVTDAIDKVMGGSQITLGGPTPGGTGGTGGRWPAPPPINPMSISPSTSVTNALLQQHSSFWVASIERLNSIVANTVPIKDLVGAIAPGRQTGDGGLVLSVAEMNFNGVQDPDGMFRAVAKRARVEARRGGVTELDVAMG